MNWDSRKVRNRILIACSASIAAGILYYLLFAPRIQEFRTILTVDAELYESHVKTLEDRGGHLDDNSYFFSPSFESRADTLADHGIRRFEMREFCLHNDNRVSIRKEYYQAFDMKVPEVIFDKKFGERTPIGASLGITLAGIALTLLIAFSWHFFHSRKEQHEK